MTTIADTHLIALVLGLYAFGLAIGFLAGLAVARRT